MYAVKGDRMKTTKESEKTKQEIEQIADENKREFIKKFGKYAGTAPLAAILLMTAGTSKAHAGSDTGP